MSQHSWGDERSASSWYSHGTDEDEVHQFHEGFFTVFSVVPASLINPLSYDLNRWLSSILLLLRHIQIINEYDLMSKGGSKLTTSLLDELSVDDHLYCPSCCLCRKSEFVIGVDIGIIGLENVFDVHGFAGSGWAAEEGWDTVVDEFPEEVLISLGILGLDKNLLCF